MLGRSQRDMNEDLFGTGSETGEPMRTRGEGHQPTPCLATKILGKHVGV